MKKVALLVAVLLVLAVVAVTKGPKVEVTCGPVASTPLTVRGIQAGQEAGGTLHRLQDGDITKWDAVMAVKGVLDTISVWYSSFHHAANNLPEDQVVTGWRTRTRAAQEKALASCCPAGVPSPAPPPAVEPFDPKQLSLQSNALTGPALAADALRQAGFPAAQIPMGVAVARYETGWRNITGPTVRGGTMRGMWQINDGVHRMVGDWRNPYDNARMAYTVWSDARSWSPWSTAGLAAQHVGEYRQYGQGTPQAPAAMGAAPNPACAQPDGLNGDITLTATLNPAGAGNWQGAVRDSQYWFVAHATAGDWSQVFHRLNAAGLEVDQMAAVGFAHATSFAVVGSTVYATNRRGQVVTFPYQPAATVTSGTPTGWSGFISKDPTGPNVVIRNGNHYQAYNAATKQPVGVQVRTDPGARQGFSISGTTVYVLTGLTNQPARVDSYDIRTGQPTGSRDITSLGASTAGSHREPEGLYGSMVGVKVNTGANRRLLIYRLGGATTPAPAASSPAGKAVAFALAQVGKPYVWANRGPAAFDCSGLTSAAWKAAGYSIIPQSSAQNRTLKHVPLSQARPGDLFWAPGHIQLFVGMRGGKRAVVEAANPRAGVRLDTSGWMKPRTVLRVTGTGANI